jgi:hypothetical protein
LETKWPSLIPNAKVVDLLKDVLSVAKTLNPETVRQHLHATATKMEQALGEEKDDLFEEFMKLRGASSKTVPDERIHCK